MRKFQFALRFAIETNEITERRRNVNPQLWKVFIVHYELLLLYPAIENPQKMIYIRFHYDLKTTQIKILSAVKKYNFFS